MRSSNLSRDSGDATCDAVCGCLDGVIGKVSITGGGLDLGVPQKLADHERAVLAGVLDDEPGRRSSHRPTGLALPHAVPDGANDMTDNACRTSSTSRPHGGTEALGRGTNAVPSASAKLVSNPGEDALGGLDRRRSGFGQYSFKIADRALE